MAQEEGEIGIVSPDFNFGSEMKLHKGVIFFYLSYFFGGLVELIFILYINYRNIDRIAFVFNFSEYPFFNLFIILSSGFYLAALCFFIKDKQVVTNSFKEIIKRKTFLLANILLSLGIILVPLSIVMFRSSQVFFYASQILLLAGLIILGISTASFIMRKLKK